jgi:hypothetical protein
LAVTLALYALFALTYSVTDSALYLIPVWMFGTWPIARGLFAVTRYSPRYSRYLLLVVFLLGPFLNLLLNYSALNLRDDHAATDFANKILAAAPPKAIVVTENDGHTFALWYHRHVAGRRPDLAVVDARQAGYPWYATMLRAQGPMPLLPEVDQTNTWIDRVAELNSNRTVCVIDPDSAQMVCRP